LLGHELQHVDERSVAAFYRRIGFKAAESEVDRFESQRAIDAGQRIMREILAPGFAASRAQ
jgi:hypothetical protein